MLDDGSLLGEGAAAGDEALWLLGSRAAAALDPAERIPTVGSAGLGAEAFPRAGFYLLREGPLHSVWDAGRLAKPGNGAHGHLDTLSGEVSVGGRVVLADSGTFGYTGDPFRRNLFRGADAHNAPVVDGEPPAIAGEGADLWRFLGDVPCKVERFEARDGSWELEARHEGYRERGIPVTVSRILSLNGSGPGLRVRDRISGAGSHRVTISWHLGQAAWTPTGEPGVFGARFGGFDVVLGVRPTDVRVSLGSSERSSRWGELFRAPMLLVEIDGPLPLEVETRLAFAQAGVASPGSWPECFPC